MFWIVDGGETVFFGADDAPQLQQMKSRFVAKYDYDGKKFMELRKQWWQMGEEKKWTFLFYHDIKTPVFNFIETGCKPFLLLILQKNIAFSYLVQIVQSSCGGSSDV